MMNANRLFSSDATIRGVSQRLYESVRDLPIISPHGHTDPRWFAENKPFPNPAELFIQPDHYIFRMLYSQGIRLETLGIPQVDGRQGADPREVWRIFAKNYFLFRGTPTRLWMDFALSEVFELPDRLHMGNANQYYDVISKKLATPEFLPRALFEKFNIELLSTTDAAVDSLEYHKAIKASGWKGRIIPTFRPDAVIDAEYSGFQENLKKLGEIADEDTFSWRGYLEALRLRREYFKLNGATATDHGHLTAQTADLSELDAEKLFRRVSTNRMGPGDVELFQAQMLTEMAGMSADDGLVMQLHPGSIRNYNTRSLGAIRVPTSLRPPSMFALCVLC